MQRTVSPAKVSVGVNSKEQLLRFRLFNKDTFLVIHVSLTAIMSKKIFSATQMLKVIKIFIERTCVYME